MPSVTFVHLNGLKECFEAGESENAMLAATRHGIDGIVAECGGNLMCATCHVYVDEVWLDRLPARAADEDEMLDETACPRKHNSRLSCQLVLDEELDGIVVALPERQI